MQLYKAQVKKYEPKADTRRHRGLRLDDGRVAREDARSAPKLDRGSVMEAARTLTNVSGVGLQIPAAKWNTSADDWFVGETFQFVKYDATAGHTVAVGGLTNDDGKTAALDAGSADQPVAHQPQRGRGDDRSRASGSVTTSRPMRVTSQSWLRTCSSLSGS